LILARRVQARLDESAIDAVVITHGTDTLEETAFFLHLVLTSDKPVVMTAAMRPATALSADGPMNLYQALSVAATPAARGRGVLVVVADRIWSARDVAKRHTQAIDALGDTDSGPLGWAHPLRFSSGRGKPPAGYLATLQMDGKASLASRFCSSRRAPPDLIAAACAFAADVIALPGSGGVPARPPTRSLFAGA
jgi:L-asparaginase